MIAQTLLGTIIEHKSVDVPVFYIVSVRSALFERFGIMTNRRGVKQGVQHCLFYRDDIRAVAPIVTLSETSEIEDVGTGREFLYEIEWVRCERQNVTGDNDIESLGGRIEKVFDRFGPESDIWNLFLCWVWIDRRHGEPAVSELYGNCPVAGSDIEYSIAGKEVESREKWKWGHGDSICEEG